MEDLAAVDRQEGGDTPLLKSRAQNYSIELLGKSIHSIFIMFSLRDMRSIPEFLPIYFYKLLTTSSNKHWALITSFCCNCPADLQFYLSCNMKNIVLQTLLQLLYCAPKRSSQLDNRDKAEGNGSGLM